MYLVVKTGEQLQSFTAACRAGQEARSEVVDADTGIRRWWPAEPVSAKKMRLYNERMAAYNAAQALKAKKEKA